jgi:hypothetical protein
VSYKTFRIKSEKGKGNSNSKATRADGNSGLILLDLGRIKKPAKKREEGKMLVPRERRLDERFVSNAPIVFSFFSTRFWHERESTTRNHSKDGMCFVSDQPLTPGTNLFIRVAEHPDSDSGIDQGAGLRSSTLANVKWCRDLSDGQRICYCVGVRYY